MTARAFRVAMCISFLWVVTAFSAGDSNLGSPERQILIPTYPIIRFAKPGQTIPSGYVKFADAGMPNTFSLEWSANSRIGSSLQLVENLVQVDVGSVTRLSIDNLGISVNGSTATATTMQSSNYTILPYDSIVFVDATSGAKVITLLVASSKTVGRVFSIYKVDSSSYPVSVVGSGSNTVNGSTVITARWQALIVIGYTPTSWISKVW